MQDKYYGFDPYEADRLETNDYYLDNITDEEIVADPEGYIAAIELQNAKEIQIRKAEIEKRRLNQKHAEKLRRRGFWGFIAGTAFAAALAFVTPQVKGSDILANQVYGVIDENGYGWRNDSQSGLIFNHYDSIVDYASAVDSIISKCEEAGMTPEQIDVGMDAVLHIRPNNSTLQERITARSDAYHESKIENRGMGK